MKKFNKPAKTDITAGNNYIAEPIEAYVDRIMNNNEPIKNGSKLIYTPREEGVIADCDPRTDKFEEMIEQMNSLHSAQMEKRAKWAEATRSKNIPEKKNADGGGTASGDDTKPKA